MMFFKINQEYKTSALNIIPKKTRMLATEGNHRYRHAKLSCLQIPFIKIRGWGLGRELTGYKWCEEKMGKTESGLRLRRWESGYRRRRTEGWITPNYNCAAEKFKIKQAFFFLLFSIMPCTILHCLKIYCFVCLFDFWFFEIRFHCSLRFPVLRIICLFLPKT